MFNVCFLLPWTDDRFQVEFARKIARHEYFVICGVHYDTERTSVFVSSFLHHYSGRVPLPLWLGAWGGRNLVVSVFWRRIRVVGVKK